jgi:hypothetical protein
VIFPRFFDRFRILFNQKVKLSQKIKRLNQDQLVRVVQILIESAPNALKEVEKCENVLISIDLEGKTPN